ncbi:hypothetical protein ABZX51_003016 [Aspergillus tubingensis]
MFSKLFIAVTTLMPILAMAAPQVDTTIHASLWSEPNRGGSLQNILDTNCHDLDLSHFRNLGSAETTPSHACNLYGYEKVV